jgi:hypothetical protein
MNFVVKFLIVTLSLCFLKSNYVLAWPMSEKEVQWIGDRIFSNECASKGECLISWNEGEDFLSLGIGHFIWYPKNVSKKFEETFPVFLKYARESNATIPACLGADISAPCPWNSREELLRSPDDACLIKLREFLISTKPLQAAFIVKRFDDILPLMLKSVAQNDRKGIAARFKRLSSSRAGTFALIDYVNFKGLGVSPSERYNGKGWGLLQVLSGMKSGSDSTDSLREFVGVAKKILEERVANSPLERNERRWLPGWQNRVESYLEK